jgi:hypothetical protein
MTNKKYVIIFVLPLIICGAFILCAAVGMLIYPDSFHKFFSATTLHREIPPELPHKSYYWDVEHYSTMAVNSNCTAFYPLWPFLIRNLFHPQTVAQAAHYFSVVASILFILCNFALFGVFKICLKNSYLVFLLVLAFTLNPMAIFRVNGYTESIFTAFSIFFIWVCLPQQRIKDNLQLILIFAITFLMATTRPILLQIFFATTATLGTMITWEMLSAKVYSWDNLLIYLKKYKHEIKITITMWVSTIFGYSIYGMFCLQTRGDFFAPFQDQKHWGKQLGLHLNLLFLPKSLLFDLLGLYLPLIVLVIAIVFVYSQVTRNEVFIPKLISIWWNILFLYPPLLIAGYIYSGIKKKSLFKVNEIIISKTTNLLAGNYIFWFSLYFTSIHSVIVFFTQDRLHSLARYVFAVPFFFLAVGYLYRCIPGKAKYHTLIWLTAVSAIALVEQWVRFGQDKWLG